LAYDVRKAFEGQRSKGYRTHFDDDRSTFPNCDRGWPDFEW